MEPDPLVNLVNNLNSRIEYLNAALANNALRFEVMSRLLLEGKTVNFDTYLNGLTNFNIFSKALTDIVKTDSIDAKLKLLADYNNSNPFFTIWLDDTQIAATFINIGEITPKTLKELLKYPHSEHIKNVLTSLLPTDDATAN